MNFLFANDQELNALLELPLIQRVTYLMGIRPYMDKQTSIVGIKRKISYQSLREVLYVGPIAGIKTGSPSQQQVRRALKSLERAGLIEIRSTEKQLIVKCVLAEMDSSFQNKADMRTTYQSDMKRINKNQEKSINYKIIHTQTDSEETPQAGTPHNSVNNIIFLRQKFELFWSTYPQPQNQPKAWDAFQRLNPDDALFEQIMAALNAQINHYEQCQKQGHWIPHWKYPANWLIQQSWNDELMTYNTLEKPHGNHQRRSTKKSAIDILWESCKDGADYVFPDEQAQSTDTNNIIPFTRRGQQR